MAAELTQQVPRLNGRPRVNGWSAMWGCSPPDGVWEFCGRGRRRIDRLVTPAGAQATSAFTPPEGRSSASGRRCPATGMPSRRPGLPAGKSSRSRRPRRWGRSRTGPEHRLLPQQAAASADTTPRGARRECGAGFGAPSPTLDQQDRKGCRRTMNIGPDWRTQRNAW